MSGKLLCYPRSLKKCANVFLSQISRTYASKKTIVQIYRSQFYPQFPEAPYNFVCQVGDPILRRKCDKVDENLINTPAFQEVGDKYIFINNFKCHHILRILPILLFQLISHMWKVHEDYECAGLSAPQIGLPLQITVIGLEIDQIKGKKSPLISSVPRRVS